MTKPYTMGRACQCVIEKIKFEFFFVLCEWVFPFCITSLVNEQMAFTLNDDCNLFYSETKLMFKTGWISLTKNKVSLLFRVGHKVFSRIWWVGLKLQSGLQLFLCSTFCHWNEFEHLFPSLCFHSKFRYGQNLIRKN